MATLVLGTVGTILGGPIGGAIGSLIGSQVDQAIIGNGPDRVGPRLAEVSVQTSSYGTPIPQIFGTMRVAGSVIWASDLQEMSNREGGGKGRPSTTTFTYSANLAVALSSRPISSVRRIWADGNLLRGIAGDFKTETLFRFYNGEEDQRVDPLIASAEGINAATAHRGISYVVFENLQLADFGNRIPSLTFEVIDGSGRITIIDIANSVTQDLVTQSGDSNITLSGYASSAGVSREALDDLLSPLPMSIRANDGDLQLIDHSVMQGVSDIISPEVIQQNQNRLDETQSFTASISEIPKELSLRYYDPSREYQAGLQSSRRPGPGRVNRTIDFPAALNVNDAQSIVALNQRQQIFARNMASMTLARDGKNYIIGDIVRCNNMHRWKIIEVEEDLGVIGLMLNKVADMTTMPEVAASGRALLPPDLRSGQTIFNILDLPAFGLRGLDRPNIAVAAGGSEAGWRRANLFQRNENIITPISTVSVAATMGRVTVPLQRASAAIVDERNRPIVILDNSNMMLQLGDVGNSSNDNFAMIGEEIIQFRSAHILDDGSYELRGLARGLGGTEEYIDNHTADERFVLLDDKQLQFIEHDDFTLGQSINIEAIGLDDDVPQVETLEDIGRSMRPLSPVHGYVNITPNEDMAIRWIRRGRGSSQWNDGVDVQLGENFERYDVTIIDMTAGHSEQILNNMMVSQSQTTVSDADLSMWRNNGVRNLQIMITQIGTYAKSEPLIMDYEIL